MFCSSHFFPFAQPSSLIPFHKTMAPIRMRMSGKLIDRYLAEHNGKADFVTRIRGSRSPSPSRQQISSTVITKLTRTGKNFTVEDVESRRERRAAYIAVA